MLNCTVQANPQSHWIRNWMSEMLIYSQPNQAERTARTSNKIEVERAWAVSIHMRCGARHSITIKWQCSLLHTCVRHTNPILAQTSRDSRQWRRQRLLLLLQVYLWKCTLLVMVILLLLCFFFSETVSEQGILWKFVHSPFSDSGLEWAAHVCFPQWIHFICYLFGCCLLVVFRYRFGSWDIQIVICIGVWSSKSSYSHWMCVQNLHSIHPFDGIRWNSLAIVFGTNGTAIFASVSMCVPPAFDGNYAFQLIYAIAWAHSTAHSSLAVWPVHLFCTLHRK